MLATRPHQAHKLEYEAVILPYEASHLHQGQRIVVTAGVEHRYWLRKALKVYPKVTLVDLAAALA